jgi:adenylate kinase family enzyme
MPIDEPQQPPLGNRIVIVGSSCAGKSTLGERLAAARGAPLVDLDALYWRPNWQPTPDEEFASRIIEATGGDRWVVAGNYSKHTMKTVWPRAETVIWLDFPLPLVLWRIVRRSWVRSRSKELLWGTNYEPFWGQFKLWSDESLIGYSLRTHRQRRKSYAGVMESPAWSHLRFVHARTKQEVERIAKTAERASGPQPVVSESPETAG